jgi:hypothetical protein
MPRGAVIGFRNTILSKIIRAVSIVHLDLLTNIALTEIVLSISYAKYSLHYFMFSIFTAKLLGDDF